MPVSIDTTEYQPYGAALDLFHSHDREILIEGPAGTGKTRAILEKIHILALKQAGIRVLFVRKTRKSLSESALTTFEEAVLPSGFKRLWSGARRGNRDKYTYPNGSEIILGGMDNPVHLFSTEFDVICVFEATELSEDEYESLHRALRHGRLGYQQVLCDCNPSYPTHWLIRRALGGRMRHLPSRHEDNPTLTPEYMETLKALTGIRHDRLYRGVWIAAEGAVWLVDTDCSAMDQGLGVLEVIICRYNLRFQPFFLQGLFEEVVKIRGHNCPYDAATR